jgi:hypothetical protein
VSRLKFSNCSSDKLDKFGAIFASLASLENLASLESLASLASLARVGYIIVKNTLLTKQAIQHLYTIIKLAGPSRLAFNYFNTCQTCQLTNCLKIEK